MNNIIKIDTKSIDTDAIRVENFEGVLDYICENIERSIILTKYLKNELTEIFGKHNTRYRGEFYYYVWILKYENEIFYISTANVKGTQISISSKFGENKSKICIEILKNIEELLK